MPSQNAYLQAMEQKEVDRSAKFQVNDTVVMTQGLPVRWKVLRRYWEEEAGIVYDLKAGSETYTGEQERHLAKAEAM